MTKTIVIDQAATPLSHNTGEIRRSRNKSPGRPHNSSNEINSRLTALEDKNTAKESEKESAENVSQTASADESESTDDSEKDNEKSEGKDTQELAGIDKRAEQVADEPYLTESEMKEGYGKDKAKKSNDKNDNKDKGESKEKKDKDKSKNAKIDLDKLASRADDVLLHTKGLFPFDLFPDTLTIDANKINIVQKTFFFTETMTSILLKEVMDVRVESALFMGQLVIDYGPHPLKISTVVVPKLRKKAALKAKEIIEGILVVYRSENINTTLLLPEETMDEVKEIGKMDARE